MFKRNFFNSAIITLFLAIAGILLFSEAQAQVACGPSLPACTGGLVCVDEICNVPPPIWDSRSFTVTGTPQNASFDVQNDSRVLGNLIVGNRDGDSGRGTGKLFTNAIFSRWGENTDHPDDIWIGDSDDSVRAQGKLFAGSGEVLTNINPSSNAGIIVGGSGSERTIGLRACDPGKILKRKIDNTGWDCADDLVGGGGPGDEPLFTNWWTNWWNNGSPSLATLKLTTGAGNDKVFTSDANGLGSWQTPASVDVSRFITQPATCGVSQILQWNGEIWICANDAIGSDGGGLSGTGVANKLAFWTGTSSLGQDTNLHWDFTNDRLGIGGNSPEEKLEIRDDTTGAARLRISDPVQNPELQLQFGYASNHWSMYVDQANGQALRFWSPATPAGNRMTITTDGKVGIGTDNPQALLHVLGARVKLNEILVGERDATSGNNLIQSLGGGLVVTAGGNGLYVSTASKIGIGTLTPVEKLDVAGNIRTTSTTQNPELQLQYGNAINDHWSVYVDQTTRDLRFWNASNKFWFSAGGDFVAERSVNANGCFGPVIVSATSGTYDGNLNSAGGYKEIDSICNGTPSLGGSHQCTTEEVMNSIHCGAIWTDVTKTTLKSIIPVGAGQYVWIGNGAPSLPTPTNDCYGWTQNEVVGIYQSRGTAWLFNNDGGASYSRSCAEARKILCCK